MLFQKHKLTAVKQSEQVSASRKSPAPWNRNARASRATAPSKPFKSLVDALMHNRTMGAVFSRERTRLLLVEAEKLYAQIPMQTRAKP